MPEKAVEVFIEHLLKSRILKSSETGSDEKISLFKNLSEKNLNLLLSHSHIQDYAAGQEIAHQGKEPDYLYYIINGEVKTLRYSEEGEEATIRMLKPGETFMDAVIFMGGTSPINVQAMAKSKLLQIPVNTVRHQALHDPQFSHNLLQIVTKHYKTAMQQIDSIVTKNPVERLGYYLLKLHLEQDPESLDMELPFQKSTIANHLGMTPETFSRALKEIKKAGIDVDRNKISMRDAFVLCHFCDPDTAQSCPKYDTEACSLCHPATHICDWSASGRKG